MISIRKAHVCMYISNPIIIGSSQTVTSLELEEFSLTKAHLKLMKRFYIHFPAVMETWTRNIIRKDW